MSTTWADFRALLRRSRLDDEIVAGSDPNWSDPQLLDGLTAALDIFAAHTALPKSLIFTASSLKPDGVTHYDLTVDTTFTLPDDLFEPLEVSGIVYIVKPNQDPVFLDPLAKTPGRSPYNENAHGFYTWPETTLNLDQAPGINSELHLRFFAYYPAPVADTDKLLVPRWSLTALSYLAAAHVLAGMSVQEAGIARFKDKTDSGTPEQSAVRKQQEYFLKLYEVEIARRSPQDRANFFREDGNLYEPY